MGRGKVELKRIQDKANRQVSFSKRRNGLMKKAHELSVMCDVDLAVFVFSSRNRLYQFSTGDRQSTILKPDQICFCFVNKKYVRLLSSVLNPQFSTVLLLAEIDHIYIGVSESRYYYARMTEILNRYQDYKHADAEAHRNTHMELALEDWELWTADKLTHMIQRHLDEHKLQQSDVTELCQLEKHVESILQQVRARKTQLKLEFVKSLQEEQKQLKQEKQFMVREIKEAKQKEINNVDG